MPQYYILYKKTLSIKAKNSLIVRLVLTKHCINFSAFHKL
jgi:hypothetical protein